MGDRDIRDWRWPEEPVEPEPGPSLLVILRGCFGRAIGWSVVAGVVLGGGYVLLMLALRLAQGTGIVGGDVTYFILFGVWQGVLVGLVVGTATGTFLAPVALISIGLRRRRSGHRGLYGVVGAVIAVLCVWGGRVRLGLPYPLLAAGPSDVIVGLVMAGLGGWWVGDRVARWYVSQTAD